MARTITVGAAQTGPVLSDDMARGVDAACSMVEEAARRKVDILAFSELFLTPFFPNRLEKDFERWFLELPSPKVEPLLKLARERGVALVFPFGEKRGAHYHNSALVLAKDGKPLGTYRKTHIPAIFPSNLPGGTGSYEKFYFSPGNEFPVFDVAGARIGIQICYDRKYPEGTRLLALQGAEIVFMPICAATYGEKKLRADTWDLPLRARSYENGVFVVAVNRVGEEDGRRHIGRSMIIDPVGAEVVAEASREAPELLVATLDLDHVREAQTSLPWSRDRRPELYAPLAGARSPGE
jgi:predicted amidohydrolase